MSQPYAIARQAIDAAHQADPKRTADGRAEELIYADRLEGWLLRLIPEPSDLLRLAARAQHLERWSLPRSSFPLDKPGYLTWRKTVHRRQGERAQEIALAAGIDVASAAHLNQLVAKGAPKHDPEGQAMEDAACLVFLEFEMAGFASEHPDYTREKYIDIIRKTWRKMSPEAHQLALGIRLPPPFAELVQAALAG